MLLHGPVGFSKSTIARRLKRGLEQYSRIEEGAWYSFKWVDLPVADGISTQTEEDCPMHEEPLKLIPIHIRRKVVDELNAKLLEQVPENRRISQYTLQCEGELDPLCKKFMEELLRKYKGDWERVVNDHIRVIRKVYSEADRCGIATFQPKDEKNQDATELTGDINYRKLTHYGSDSDARAFSFDGEFCFPAGTPVRMANGTEKTVEQIQEGDEVITHLGRSDVVISTMSRKYTGDMVTMEIKGFPFSLTMTADHPVAVVSSRCNWRWQPGELEWKKAVELTADDRVLIGYNRQVVPRGLLDLADVLGLDAVVSSSEYEVVCRPNTMHNKAVSRYVRISPSLARFIGLYLAEGGCYEGKKVVFNLSSKEIALADEIIALAKGLFGVIGTTRVVNERKTGRVVEFHNSNLYDVINHYIPGNVYTKRVPEVFFNQDEQVKLALIFGWMDGDGHKIIRKVNGKSVVRMTGVTSSEGLARDITVLALSSGIVATTSYRKARGCSKKSYAVDLSGRKAVAMVPSLVLQAADAGIKLWNVDSNRTEYGYVRCIKNLSITSVADVQVYDFEVERDHSFLANDLVVHNCVGNRGMIEFIEALKLAQEFLYDLLGATQEKQIKPKKFAQIMIDEAIIAHTNNPEYERLKNNQYMEALCDRTVKIDVPYLVKLADEIRVLEHDYGPGKVRQHVAPHTLEIAALWDVLTRLDDDKEGNLDLVQKVKLYNGQMLPNYTEDSVKELRDKYPDEGMTHGVSARYTQDKISNCLSNNYEYINAFMVLNEIREGLDASSLITKKEDIGRYHTCVDLAIKEYDEIVKDEVRRALVGDEDAIVRLCTNYIDNVMAYIKRSRVKNPFTGREEPANERLMRSIEEKIEIPDGQVDDFRRMIAAFIGDCAHEGKTFRWDSNPELKKALEAELFERTKNHIKLSALHISGAATVSPDLQEKIDAIKKRLIENYGYNEKSATDVLDYVGSIFSRGAIQDSDG